MSTFYGPTTVQSVGNIMTNEVERASVLTELSVKS